MERKLMTYLFFMISIMCMFVSSLIVLLIENLGIPTRIISNTILLGTIIIGIAFIIVLFIERLKKQISEKIEEVEKID